MLLYVRRLALVNKRFQQGGPIFNGIVNAHMTDKREGTRILLAALRDVMTNSGLPVAEIAKKVDVTRQYLHMLKRGEGNPTLDTIEKIFEACDDDFGAWLAENVADRYGRDKALHDRFQALLNAKGEIGRLTRGTLDAYTSRLAELQAEKRREQTEKGNEAERSESTDSTHKK